MLPTNQKPSCSSSTNKTSQITKKSCFSNWFAKNQLMSQKKMTLDLMLQSTLSRMQRIWKERIKKTTKKIEVPIDNFAEKNSHNQRLSQLSRRFWRRKRAFYDHMLIVQLMGKLILSKTELNLFKRSDTRVLLPRIFFFKDFKDSKCSNKQCWIHYNYNKEIALLDSQFMMYFKILQKANIDSSNVLFWNIYVFKIWKRAKEHKPLMSELLYLGLYAKSFFLELCYFDLEDLGEIRPSSNHQSHSPQTSASFRLLLKITI